MMLCCGCEVIAENSLFPINTQMRDNFTKKLITLLLSHEPSHYSFGFPSREHKVSTHQKLAAI